QSPCCESSKRSNEYHDWVGEGEPDASETGTSAGRSCNNGTSDSGPLALDPTSAATSVAIRNDRRVPSCVIQNVAEALHRFSRSPGTGAVFCRAFTISLGCVISESETVSSPVSDSHSAPASDS